MLEFFLLSSVLEGFPNVLSEAMAHRLACISFDCDTGPRDMIEHGANGLLVDPSEKEFGLVNAMRSLLADQNLRAKLANNAIYVRDRYAESSIMREWDIELDLEH